MKKTALLLVVILVLSVFAFASCDKLPWGKKECKDHVDENRDYICDNCEAELEKPKPEDPIPPACQHKDEVKDHKCDSCGETLSQCADANKDHKCDTCETAMGEHKAPDNGHKCGYCGGVVTYCIDDNNDDICDVCGGDVDHVSYEFNVSGSEAVEAGLKEDLINGRFTVVSGTVIRNRKKTCEGIEYTQSIKIGAKANMIKVDVPGNGKLSFVIQNGSSSAPTQFVTLTAPDGTVYDVEFAGTDEGSPAVMLTVDVTPGEWTIGRGKNGGTIDIFYLHLAAVVERSEECGFEIVSKGTVDYLCGQTLDVSGLRLNGVYGNGKTEPLTSDAFTVDTSLVNMGVAGSYSISVSYKDYAPLTYNVNVYLPTSISLGYDATEQTGQSAAGNGLYINHSFKEVYPIGGTLDLSGLSVTVTGTLDNADKKFIVKNYQVGQIDLSTAGEKSLAISYVFGSESVSANAEIHVVDTEPSIVDGVYQVKVDDGYAGVIGAVADGYNCFATIQQALDFLASSDASKKKLMVIEEGYYLEKLEINIPNLHIKGAGADKVVIEWNSIYGVPDASGFSQVTDSTQTVAVRDGAVNMTIEGVTISNYWNTQDRMDAAGLGIERGLALLVMADRFIMKDSRLLGIQDTLELFTGRQYFENVYISGYTDFIFGTNNTTLFNKCTIHVIDTSKDDSGTAGYITAFKGSNKGASDAIVYGAIFYDCDFTADAGVSAGKTAIGRTWGAYAAVAVINSDLGGHISVDAYDSSNNKNKRYISMNGIHPTDSTVQFVEYGNTGAGAITAAVAGMKMLTQEQAALYTDISVIFGKTNGKVNWLDAWDPTSTEEQVDDRTYYYFNGQTGSSGTCYTYSGNTQGAAGTLGNIAIDATASGAKVTARSSDTQINAGATLTFNVSAGTLVTINFYPSYGNCDINGTAYTSATDVELYFAADTTVVITATATSYLYSIIINPGEAAPAA